MKVIRVVSRVLGITGTCFMVILMLLVGLSMKLSGKMIFNKKLKKVLS